MSHYTVLVVGDDVAEQLAPFDENRATEYFGETDAGEQARWDWYQIGGRWAGSLTIKPEYADDVPVPEFSWGWSAEDQAEVIASYRTDQARKGQLDIEAMIEARRDGVRNRYAKARSELSEGKIKPDLIRFIYGLDPEELDDTYEAKAVEAITTPLSVYAVLVNGEWHEPGRMGWFGSHDATDDSEAAHDAWFAELWDSLPDDTLLTVVDCHI